jgi:hypothetical protein
MLLLAAIVITVATFKVAEGYNNER